VVAILLSLVSAFFYALGNVLQHSAANDQPTHQPLFLGLVRSPTWLAGNLVNGIGWTVHLVALLYGELMLVQPLMLTSILFSLPLTAWMRHYRLQRNDWLGAGATAVGIAVFLLAARPEATEAVTMQRWPLAFGSVAVACLGTLLAVPASGRVTGLGVAAGLLFGASAAGTKAALIGYQQMGTAVFLTWSPGLTFVIGLGAFYLAQKAYHAGHMVASFPALMSVEPLVACLLAAALFGERMQSTPLALTLETVGVLSTLWGIVHLARTVEDQQRHST
jgi:uncharacterized membrane protein